MAFLSFGSMNIDYVYHIDDVVKEGQTVSAKEREINAGGKGLNQAVALAKAGAKVAFGGRVGNDGEILLETLKKSGVDTSLISISEKGSGHAIIQVDRNGNNCIIVYGGANYDNSEEYIDKVLASFQAGDFVVLQNEMNNIGYIMKKACERGLRILFNPSPFNEAVYGYPLDLVDVLNVNEHEGQAIAFPDCAAEKEKSPESIMDGLIKKFPGTKIILTLGKKGAIFFDGDKLYHHGIFDLPVVDTTAAGDTFTGFFMSLYSMGEDPEKALKTASAASSLCVSRHGASISIPNVEEVENFLRENI